MSFEASWKDENAVLLASAFLNLESEEDVYRLLDDLCTIAEIKAMIQRIHVAQLLYKDTTYNIISRETGASTATISRVNRCLNYGANGYKTVLGKLEKEPENEK